MSHQNMCVLQYYGKISRAKKSTDMYHALSCNVDILIAP